MRDLCAKWEEEEEADFGTLAAGLDMWTMALDSKSKEAEESPETTKETKKTKRRHRNKGDDHEEEERMADEATSKLLRIIHLVCTSIRNQNLSSNLQKFVLDMKVEQFNIEKKQSDIEEKERHHPIHGTTEKATAVEAKKRIGYFDSYRQNGMAKVESVEPAPDTWRPYRQNDHHSGATQYAITRQTAKDREIRRQTAKGKEDKSEIEPDEKDSFTLRSQHPPRIRDEEPGFETGFGTSVLAKSGSEAVPTSVLSKSRAAAKKLNYRGGMSGGELPVAAAEDEDADDEKKGMETLLYSVRSQARHDRANQTIRFWHDSAVSKPRDGFDSDLRQSSRAADVESQLDLIQQQHLPTCKDSRLPKPGATLPHVSKAKFGDADGSPTHRKSSATAMRRRNSSAMLDVAPKQINFLSWGREASAASAEQASATNALRELDRTAAHGMSLPQSHKGSRPHARPAVARRLHATLAEYDLPRSATLAELPPVVDPKKDRNKKRHHMSAEHLTGDQKKRLDRQADYDGRTLNDLQERLAAQTLEELDGNASLSAADNDEDSVKDVAPSPGASDAGDLAEPDDSSKRVDTGMDVRKTFVASDHLFATPEVPRPFELMLTSSAEKSIKGKVERHAARANYDIKSKLSGDLKKKARAMDVDELAESTYWKWNEDTGGYLLAERNQDPITERQVLEEHVLEERRPALVPDSIKLASVAFKRKDVTPKIPKDMIKDFEEWVAANHDKMVDVFLKLMKAASEDNAPPMNVMDFVKYLKILRYHAGTEETNVIFKEMNTPGDGALKLKEVRMYIEIVNRAKKVRKQRLVNKMKSAFKAKTYVEYMMDDMRKQETAMKLAKQIEDEEALLRELDKLTDYDESVPPPPERDKRMMAVGDIVQRAELMYFQRCEELRILPKFSNDVADSEQEKMRVDHVSFRGLLLNRPNDVAATFSLLGGLKTPLQGLDCSGNALAATSTEVVCEEIYVRPNLHALTQLDLRGNTFGADGAKMLCKLIPKLTYLAHLSLAECSIPDAEWALVSHALCETTRMHTLDVSTCRLGYQKQAPCVQIARLLSELGGQLHCLKLGGNFFGYAGFEALAVEIRKSTALKVLDLSYNAGGFACVNLDDENKGWKTTTEEVAESAPFPPIQLLLEAIGENISLAELYLREVGIGVASDRILEEVIPRHPTIKVLDLSDNPHGLEGLRCMLRQFLDPNCVLHKCDMENFRELQEKGGLPGPAGTNTILEAAGGLGVPQKADHPGEARFDYRNPSGEYCLKLHNPQHRAVLLLLLRRMKHYRQSIDDTFTAVSHLGKSTKLSQVVKEKKLVPGGVSVPYELPRSGTLIFTFVVLLESIVQSDYTRKMVVKKYIETRRTIITLGRMVGLTQMYKAMTGVWQKQCILEVLSSEFLLNISQLRWFLKNTPFFGHMEYWVCSRIIPALHHDADPEHIGRTIEALKIKASKHKLYAEIRKLIYFNIEVMTDHYCLALDTHAERAVAERICSINLWESMKAQAEGERDRSMYGDYDQIRNFVFRRGRIPEAFDYKSVAVAFPPVGEVELHYVATKRMLIGAPINPLQFVKLCEMMRGQIRARGRILALRSIADRLCLSAEQVIDLGNAIKDSSGRGTEGEMVDGDKSRALRRSVTGAPEELFLTSGETARTHVVLCMLSQCKDLDSLFSCAPRSGVYKEFDIDEQQYLMHVLGPLVAFDPLHLHDKESNCGNLFKVNLAHDEGQKILKFLLEVITHEKTSNDEKSEYYKDLLAENPDTPPYKHPIMDSVEWTPAAVDPADGKAYTKDEFIAHYGGTVEWEKAAEADGSVKQADFEAFPPEEEKARYEAFIKQFLNKPPDKGVLRFRYDRVPVVDLEKRKELARQHLGWVGGLLSGEALKDHLGRMRNPNAAAGGGR